MTKDPRFVAMIWCALLLSGVLAATPASAQQARLTKLTDIAFGSLTTFASDVVRSENVCAYSTGTSSPSFGRHSEVSTLHKPTIIGSAPTEFGGDGQNWAPEDLFVAAVSQCHMLTYLFVCARTGIVVESYHDRAVGTLDVEGAAGGQFREIVLHPEVVISRGDPQRAVALHDDATKGCYIGRSIRTAVRVEATVTPSHKEGSDHQ